MSYDLFLWQRDRNKSIEEELETLLYTPPTNQPEINGSSKEQLKKVASTIDQACPDWDSTWLNEMQFDSNTPEGLSYGVVISANIVNNQVVIHITASYGDVGSALQAVSKPIEALSTLGFVCFDEQSEELISATDLNKPVSKKSWWKFW